MKRSIIFILFSCLAVAAMAAENTKLIEANAEYQKENFEAAANLYEEILQTGESATVYYNLGNAYYKSGKLAPAILNYERALLRDPGNENIRYNLEMAYSQTVDKVDPVGRFFLLNWIDGLSATHSTNTWAYISIFCFILTLILAGAFVFARVTWLKKTAFFTGIAVLVICAVSFVFSSNQKNKLIAHNYAIIFTPTVTAKSSPDASGTELFPLHEGTKVKIKRKLGDWIEIQLENGHVGWIKSSVAETI
jgi:tetratricopeptide (TPR) repeat protein